MTDISRLSDLIVRFFIVDIQKLLPSHRSFDTTLMDYPTRFFVNCLLVNTCFLTMSHKVEFILRFELPWGWGWALLRIKPCRLIIYPNYILLLFLFLLMLPIRSCIGRMLLSVKIQMLKDDWLFSYVIGFLVFFFNDDDWLIFQSLTTINTSPGRGLFFLFFA
jgi:hypothetical protein